MTSKELLHKKKEVEGFELLEAITTACDFVRQKKPGKVLAMWMRRHFSPER